MLLDELRAFSFQLRSLELGFRVAELHRKDFWRLEIATAKKYIALVEEEWNAKNNTSFKQMKFDTLIQDAKIDLEGQPVVASPEEPATQESAAAEQL